MKVILDVWFSPDGKAVDAVSASKEIDMPAAPFPGMFIMQSVWKAPLLIGDNGVTYDVDSNSFSIYLGIQPLNEQQFYPDHGWTLHQ